MYSVYTVFLEHDSGGKFYEACLIVVGGTEKALLVKRWGAIGRKSGGGQVQTQPGDAGAVTLAFSRLLDDKKLARPGKGCYVAMAKPPFGLHRLHASDIVSERQLVDALERHYGAPDKKLVCRRLVELGAPNFGALGDHDGVAAPPPPPSAAPEPARCERWGSW